LHFCSNLLLEVFASLSFSLPEGTFFGTHDGLKGKPVQLHKFNKRCMDLIVHKLLSMRSIKASKSETTRVAPASTNVLLSWPVVKATTGMPAATAACNKQHISEK